MMFEMVARFLSQKGQNQSSSISYVIGVSKTSLGSRYLVYIVSLHDLFSEST